MTGLASREALARLRFSCLVACAAAATLASPGASAGPRLAEVEFQRLNPCPANNAREGDCPGYAIQHVVPLCLGGPDVAYNLRWQRLADLKRNEVADARDCRAPTQEAHPPVAEIPFSRT